MTAINATQQSQPKPPTVIVGGGFVGIFTALHLSHWHYTNPVILIDPQSSFVFKPLLYEYLTEEIRDDQIVPAYDALLHDSGITLVQGKVAQIDLHQRSVILEDKSCYSYGHLVLGVGSIQSYLGTEGAEEHAFSFLNQADARSLKQHLKNCLQKASQTTDTALKQDLLTIAVVGAGPSGIEIAATLADLLPAWYEQLDQNGQDIKIVLINHGDDILQGDVNTHLRETTLKALKSRAVPVELRLGVGVKSVSADELFYQAKGKETTERLRTTTTIWTAGTATSPLIASLSLPATARDQHNRPWVSPTLQLPDFPNVFMAGDCASVQSEVLPAVAQIAYQQGAGIARNLIALALNQPPQPVHAHMRGTLMKLGIRRGVANLFDKAQITGEAGDLIRKGVYVEMLPTPIRDLKATAEWLSDEVFERHLPSVSEQSELADEGLETSETTNETAHRQQNGTVVWIGGIAIALILLLGFSFVIRSRQPSQPDPPPTQPQSKLLYRQTV